MGDFIVLFCLMLLAVAIWLIIRMLKNSRSRTADLALTVDKTAIHPGQALQASVEMALKRSVKVRRATVELLRVETYILKVRNKHGTSYHRKTVEHSVAGQVFVEGQELQAKDRVETGMTCTVPWDALPTARGHIVHGIIPGVSWKMKAKFDIPNKLDITKELEITVNEPPIAGVPTPRPTVAESDHRACSLTLLLDSADIYRGGSLQGVLRAQMHKNVDVDRVIVEFSGIEKFGDVKRTVDADELILFQDPVLQAGRTYEWPFLVDTREGNVPTLQLDKSKVEYSVTGKLDRKMRLDPSVSQSIRILVSSAGGPHTSPSSTAIADSGHHADSGPHRMV